MAYLTQHKSGDERNRPYEGDLPIHEWYRFVLSYPPHLVRDYIKKFALDKGGLVLDPFCGTGTTLVEAKKLGIPSIGLETNPVVHFAAQTKTDWSGDPEALEKHAEAVAAQVLEQLETDGVPDAPFFSPLDASSPPKLRKLPPHQSKLLIRDSISPRPLHKALVLRHALADHSCFSKYERLAVAKHAVYTFSNLRFGPEVGVGKKKDDIPVVAPWLAEIHSMAEDLRTFGSNDAIPARVLLADARNLNGHIKPKSVSAVITSPPTPTKRITPAQRALSLCFLGSCGIAKISGASNRRSFALTHEMFIKGCKMM